MIDHTRKAGTKLKYGAMRYTNGSALSGVKPSLRISFSPSARVCNKPYGPALFGPTRFCRPAIALRSNQMTMIVDTNASAKTASTLIAMIRISCQPSSPEINIGSRDNSAFMRSDARHGRR